MAIIERDIVLMSKDNNGNSAILKPLTRLANIEADADIKEAPADGDFIPVIDSEDNEQMKMISVSKLAGNGDSASIKSAEYTNSTIKLYTTVDKSGEAAAEINLPKEMFLDQAKTEFVSNFLWNEQYYPEATDPNLNGEPVLVLAVKTEDETINYSFISLSDMIKTYVGLESDTAAVTVDGQNIQVEVKFPDNEWNLLKMTNTGLVVDKDDIKAFLSGDFENCAKIDKDPMFKGQITIDAETDYPVQIGGNDPIFIDSPYNSSNIKKLFYVSYTGDNWKMVQYRSHTGEAVLIEESSFEFRDGEIYSNYNITAPNITELSDNSATNSEAIQTLQTELNTAKSELASVTERLTAAEAELADIKTQLGALSGYMLQKDENGLYINDEAQGGII